MVDIQPNPRHRGRNEGSLRKLQNGKYRAWVSLPLGRRVSKTFTTRVEATSWIHKQSMDTNNMTIEKSSQTVKTYLTDWLLDRQKYNELRESTFIDYQANIQKYINPLVGNKMLSSLNKPLIKAFYDQLTKDNIGIYQINYVHRILRKALNDAVNDDIIESNPFVKVKPPRIVVGVRKHSPLNQPQAIHLATIASRYSIGPIINLALKTGMRQGELLAFQWEDIHWEKQMIFIQRTVTKTLIDGRVSRKFGPPKTVAGSRWVTLDAEILELLMYQREHVKMMRGFAGEKWVDNNLVFPSSVGTPLNPSNIRKTYNIVLREAHLPQIRFHDLRHTFASIALGNGVPLIAVSYILGHSKMSTTSDIYAHMLDIRDHTVPNLMSEIFKSVPLPSLYDGYKIG